MRENQKEELPPTHSTNSLFSESAVKLLAAYRIWIVAAGIWLLENVEFQFGLLRVR